MKRAERDFRVLFNGMADEAIITRTELAELLSVTDGAIRQMSFKGELPPTAFPEKRRLQWFAGDLRRWLQSRLQARLTYGQQQSVNDVMPPSPAARAGRPRRATDVASALGS